LNVASTPVVVGAKARVARRLVASLAITCVGCSASVSPTCSPPAASSLPPAAQASHDATTHHSFEDVEHWKKVFDDPRRDSWQKPAEVVRALTLEPGMTIADLGAGTGYFLPYLSAAVGGHGTVFAVEVEPNLVVHIRRRVEDGMIRNVVPVLASMNDAHLPYRQLDLILIVDTYHHLDARLVYLRRLAHALKPGGRVAVVDWLKRELPEGPPPAHKLSREHVLEEMRTAGYELVDEPTFLPYQYFLIFEPRAQDPPHAEYTPESGR